MSYTREESLKQIRKHISNIETLYQSDFLNRVGRTSDTRQSYSEIFSEEILKNLALFDSAPMITRQKSYYTPSHARMRFDLERSNRNEENFAKRLNQLSIDELGTILDFQVPLKNTQKDKGVGKIDLVSFSTDKNEFYLIELKHGTNKETLLRAVLESYTYYRRVDHKKLLMDFAHGLGLKNSIRKRKILVKPAVMVTPGCNSYKELAEMQGGKRPILMELATAMRIVFFTLDFQVNKYAY